MGNRERSVEVYVAETLPFCIHKNEPHATQNLLEGTLRSQNPYSGWDSPLTPYSNLMPPPGPWPQACGHSFAALPSKACSLWREHSGKECSPVENCCLWWPFWAVLCIYSMYSSFSSSFPVGYGNGLNFLSKSSELPSLEEALWFLKLDDIHQTKFTFKNGAVVQSERSCCSQQGVTCPGWRSGSLMGWRERVGPADLLLNIFKYSCHRLYRIRIKRRVGKSEQWEIPFWVSVYASNSWNIATVLEKKMYKWIIHSKEC